MMARLWAALLLSSLVAEVSSSGEEPASSCTSGWSLFGDRCFAFFPVWSSWSDANSLCAQTQSELVSLNTREELRFLHQLANRSAPVWLGHRAQNGSCSDGAPLSSAARTGHALERACVELEPSGELHSAPCGQLRFYICSTSCCTSVLPSRKPVDPELVPGVSLFDTVWSKSDLLVEEILHSSSFLGALASGRLTEQCYTRFLQQEALYLRRVSITLQTLTARLQEDDGMRALLLDTLQHYRSRVESSDASSPPEWLHLPLQAFHSVVLEDPVYWLVALSARASLREFLAGELLPERVRPEPQAVNRTLYQTWSRDGLHEAAWTQRYRAMIEEHQNQMDVFKAINIFRAHMMGQKSFYKSVVCDVEDEG